MKNKLIGICAVLIAATCLAGELSTRFNGDTSNVPYATTNNYTTEALFSVGNSETLGIFVKFAATGTNANAQLLTIQTSMNKEDWFPFLQWSITATGTTNVAAATNLTTSAWPFFKLASWGNPNTTNGITNIFISGWTKPR